MKHKDADEWKHTTATRLDMENDAVGVDLFDDEQPGFVSIYIRFPSGGRWPARTVNMSNPEHAQSVLEAWSKRGPVNDFRRKGDS